MDATDVVIDVVNLPLRESWWQEFRQAWEQSQIDPWQSRLRALLGAPATLHWNCVCILARQPDSGAILSAAVLDIPRRVTPTAFRTGWVAHVFTLPQTRGCGLATQVVEQALTQASLAGAVEVRLATSQAHMPASLYAKLGFSPVSTPGCVMQRELEQSRQSDTAQRVLTDDDVVFCVRVDDLGACAGIAARTHYRVEGGVMQEEEAIDIEELACTLLSLGPDLGTVAYLRAGEHITVGVWDVPATSSDAPIRLVAADAPLERIAETIRSLRIPVSFVHQEFSYLRAHDSVA